MVAQYCRLTGVRLAHHWILTHCFRGQTLVSESESLRFDSQLQGRGFALLRTSTVGRISPPVLLGLQRLYSLDRFVIIIICSFSDKKTFLVVNAQRTIYRSFPPLRNHFLYVIYDYENAIFKKWRFIDPYVKNIIENSSVFQLLFVAKGLWCFKYPVCYEHLQHRHNQSLTSHIIILLHKCERNKNDEQIIFLSPATHKGISGKYWLIWKEIQCYIINIGNCD